MRISLSKTFTFTYVTYICGITGATRDVVGGGGPTLGLGFEFFWVSVISGAKEDFIESPFASFGGPGGGGGSIWDKILALLDSVATGAIGFIGLAMAGFEAGKGWDTGGGISFGGSDITFGGIFIGGGGTAPLLAAAIGGGGCGAEVGPGGGAEDGVLLMTSDRSPESTETSGFLMKCHCWHYINL